MSSARPPLAARLRPCGPVVDGEAAERARARLSEAAAEGGWSGLLDTAWPALEPVFGASPYLTTLAVRAPERLQRVLQDDPEARLEALIAPGSGGDLEPVKRELRARKAELHVLTALCDLGGVWDLDQVTGVIARFADVAVQDALACAAEAEIARGRLLRPENDVRGPAPGLFVLALGKHGALELNYSSDIDVSVFFEPERLPVAASAEPQAVALRLTQTLANVLQERTADGYVFRVDLRLRPDPSSTPAALPVEAALAYYESVGQNWERAALIKARVCAGDAQAGAAFLAALQPFVWRRNLDFAAIADIQSIKQQIHVHKADERLTAPGANLKLGAGGIREIEFYAQTQQLILGGRDPGLRTPRTLDALAALAAAGRVEPQAERELAAAYRRLRAWEHRVQMLADEQTHVLPERGEDRRRVAALSGFGELAAFDAAVSATLRAVNARYGALFAEAEPLSSSFGSLVFTGVDDDPETLATLRRMGFADPSRVSGAIRGWHHGRIAATRTERGRELFTRLAPRLLMAAQATGAPDAAFDRFGAFFEGLRSGVQVQSLFLNEPRLFEMIVRVMAFAPELARTLARRPAALDALLDPGFFGPLDPAEMAASIAHAVARADGFEGAMDAARRAHREEAFRIGLQVMSGTASAEAAGRAFTALADACLGALAPVALSEVERLGGAFPGRCAVLALGKAGGREMTARSDLDLMTVYEAESPDAASRRKGWGAETFYARFTQRLVAALSAPTSEGELYKVDLQLRPTGTAGPVAVSLPGLAAYYAAQAETWEFLALTRARVAWASDAGFAARVEAAVEAALRRARDAVATAQDVRDMRDLMARERPPFGAWDLKLAPGGFVDIEFAAQHLQLIHAAAGGPLRTHTGEALAALREAGLAETALLDDLISARQLQQALSEVLKLALADPADPTAEPAPFRQLLAEAAGLDCFEALQRTLAERQRAARAAYAQIVAAGTFG